jgi:hypothetical protein
MGTLHHAWINPHVHHLLVHQDDVIEAQNHPSPRWIVVSTMVDYLCGEMRIPSFIAMVFLAAQRYSIQQAVTSLMSKSVAIPVMGRDYLATKGSIFIIVEIFVDVYHQRTPMDMWSLCATP